MPQTPHSLKITPFSPPIPLTPLTTKNQGNFPNNKKTFLTKLDKSKKGDIDQRALPLLNAINQLPNYYTTSSCSGRVYLWTGSGKKNETQWLKVSHDLIDDSFFTLSQPTPNLVWLRFEPFILHICCKDLKSANYLLNEAHLLYKKSSLLSISKKIILEIRSSELIEMPLYDNHHLLFDQEFSYLTQLINQRMVNMWQRMDKFEEMIQKLKP